MSLLKSLLVRSIVCFMSLAALTFLSACSAETKTPGINPEETAAAAPSLVVIPGTPTAGINSTPIPSSTPSFTPSITPTYPPFSSLKPFYWRDWQVNPDLSPEALSILRNAINNPNLDLHIFSKVGDCQMTSGTFLGGFVSGAYTIPDGFNETVTWFSDSMSGESITAAIGLGVNSVLDPLFGLPAGNKQCQAVETPLDCELRTRHPAVVLIAMGTNWIPHGEASFEKYLRIVVDRVLATGALPILATKADNIEEDWKLDQAIAQVAYDYNLPLVNVWRSVQDLPNHGLVSPKNEYLTGDGWMRRNYAWLKILEKVRLVLVK